MDTQQNGIKVSISIKSYTVAIFLNGLLHRLIKRQKLIDIQSWKEAENDWRIEYTYEDGTSTYSQYESKDLWEAILKKLSEKEFIS